MNKFIAGGSKRFLWLKMIFGLVLCLLFLAPAFFAIEIISHLARPLSLTIRLRTNMFADHQVLNVFSNLAPIGVPVVFYGMGLFVSLVQSYVFTLLTTIYIGLAVSHDH